MKSTGRARSPPYRITNTTLFETIPGKKEKQLMETSLWLVALPLLLQPVPASPARRKLHGEFKKAIRHVSKTKKSNLHPCSLQNLSLNDSFTLEKQSTRNAHVRSL